MNIFRSKEGLFGSAVTAMDSSLAAQYDCYEWNTTTVASACSNREIATKQWMNSMVTENPPTELEGLYGWEKTNTVADWTD